MYKGLLKGGRAETTSGADLFAPIAKELLPERSQARGRSPRDLVLEHAEELKREAAAQGYAEGMRQGNEVGYEKGYEAGRREGESALRSEHEAALQEAVDLFTNDLDQVVESVNSAVAQWYSEAEQRLAALAAETVVRLLRTELLTQPETVLSLVRETLREAGEARTVRVRLAPFDYPYLVNAREQLLLTCQHIKRLEFVEDGSLSGGCVVEAEQGVVDRSVDVFTELIREAA